VGRSGSSASIEAVEAMIDELEMDADHGEITAAEIEMSRDRETTIEAGGSWQRLGDVVDRIAGRLEGS